jgi:2-keto-3-deoxy-L-rhamnonate aldolase RhmA
VPKSSQEKASHDSVFAIPAFAQYVSPFHRERETLIGCWASLASPITTELLGMVGFDWILLDAEHAPNDVLSLIPQLMALKDSRSAPVVRPPANDSVVKAPARQRLLRLPGSLRR